MSATRLAATLVVLTVAALPWPSATAARGKLGRVTDVWSDDLTLLQAQVAAACLTNFTTAAAHGGVSGLGSEASRNPPSFDCLRDAKCAVCWNASLWDPREATNCERLCPTNSTACLASCRQLSALYNQSKKLTQTSATKTKRRDLPPRPVVSVSSDRLFFTGISWPGRGDAFQLVLVVQARFDYVGSTEATSGNWRNLTLLVGGPGPVRLEEPRPGHRYQFRAAAVAPYGTLGFGEPTEPLTLLPLFPAVDSTSAPTSPVRLNSGPARYDESTGWSSVPVWWSGGGAVAHQFLVSWTKVPTTINDASNPDSAVKISQTLPGTARSYHIKHLEPDSLYHVEVRELSASGARGPPSQISISTARQPAVAWHQASASVRDLDGDCPPDGESNQSAATPRTSFSVNVDHEGGIGERRRRARIVATIGLPKLHPGALGAAYNAGSGIYLLEWRRRVCIGAARTSHADGFGSGAAMSGAILASARELQISAVRLGGLEFNCHYWARLTALSDRRHQTLRQPVQKTFIAEWCFATPADCGKGLPGCGLLDYRDTEPAAPAAPVKVTVQSLAASTSDESNPGCLVTWQRPSTAAGHLVKPSAYRVVWGPRLDESVALDTFQYDRMQPRVDPSRASTRVVDETVTSLTIRPLSRATLYIVKVRSLAFHPNGRLLASKDVTQLCSTEGFSRLHSIGRTAVLQQQQQHRTALEGEFSQFLSASQSPAVQPSLKRHQILILCALAAFLLLLQSVM